MTPCYICGSPISELRLDARDMKTRPCMTCEQVISEAARPLAKDRQDEENEAFFNTSLDDYLATKRVYHDYE